MVLGYIGSIASGPMDDTGGSRGMIHTLMMICTLVVLEVEDYLWMIRMLLEDVKTLTSKRQLFFLHLLIGINCFYTCHELLLLVSVLSCLDDVLC